MKERFPPQPNIGSKFGDDREIRLVALHLLVASKKRATNSGCVKIAGCPARVHPNPTTNLTSCGNTNTSPTPADHLTMYAPRSGYPYGPSQLRPPQVRPSSPITEPPAGATASGRKDI